jgi:hypothetical protein
LELAMSLARVYEKKHNRGTASNSRVASRSVAPSRPHVTVVPRSNTNTTSSTGQDETGPRTFRKLTAAEMAERRRQGLCFNCDEKFVRGHHCTHLFYTEYDNEAADDEGSWPTAEENIEPVISLYAVTGITSGETMRLVVEINGCSLRSTHSFINEDVVQRLALPVQPARDGLRVTVANGDRLISKGIYRTLRLSIGNAVFDVDCYALSLGGFDVILGTQWLRALGPILWDFAKLTMSFWFGDRLVRFQGSQSAGAPLHTITSIGPDLLLSLLADYEDLFVPLTELPRKRFQDHQIRLHAGSTLVAVRPYRYPQIQKDEIERQCAEMLAQGIIQLSNSEFSSPILLVTKHDKSWRFCVDYRALNAQTIKDKFPIPVVDELLDELKGSRFFTKLDLRCGYHQVRMHSDDVASAFRTHHHHFEFLVLPFGLTNAPTTFQALMNAVLGPFLRWFVLVFFDDILIYSTTWSDHLRHIHVVLEKLHHHKLVLKRSKCSLVSLLSPTLAMSYQNGELPWTARRFKPLRIGRNHVPFVLCEVF